MPTADLRRAVPARIPPLDDVPSKMQPGDLYPERLTPDGPVVGYVYACVGCGRLSHIALPGALTPGPRWTATGDPGRVADLTLSPSILHDPAQGGCGWHGWLRDGVFAPC